MKTPEEMTEFFRAMPSKKKENPYWVFNKEQPCIEAIQHDRENLPFNLPMTTLLLVSVRNFFRHYYESFYSEAQVLCVTPKDGDKLNAMGIPVLTKGMVGPFGATVVVLPQDNSGGTSRIGESFWQNQIVNEGIKPLARIHSHHVLDPYQSSTDYSTLNSGTLEMVIGKIYEKNLNVCYWLDVPGTDIKAQTFMAKQNEDNTFEIIPHRFHGPNPSPKTGKVMLKGTFPTPPQDALKMATICAEAMDGKDTK